MIVEKTASYNPENMTNFWGKKDKNTGKKLPLVAHCIDVGLVFYNLCNILGFKYVLNKTANNFPLEDYHIQRLSVLAILHDIGKLNLGFFYKDEVEPGHEFYESNKGHKYELNGLLENPNFKKFNDVVLNKIRGWFEKKKHLNAYLMASFSHHGFPLTLEKGDRSLENKKLWEKNPQSDTPDPFHGMSEIVYWAEAIFPEAFNYENRTPIPPNPQLQHIFAGMVILADWLGSNSLHFPIEKQNINKRIEQDKIIIPEMLKCTGLNTSIWRNDFLKPDLNNFHARFGYEPYPLQQFTDGLNPMDESNKLLIIESETGSGKTEAALNWYYRLFAAGLVDSLYFALPTRVAAGEMYKRVSDTIGRWFKKGTAPPVALAIPGYARIDIDKEEIEKKQLLPEATEGNRWEDEDANHDIAWAIRNSKSFLAAPIAVGTIDQALLSALRTAHAHLRSVCLSKSLLVVDEVHASDYYITELLKHLLKVHFQVGGKAMLLSATLGSVAHTKYIGVANNSSPACPDLTKAKNRPYPAVTVASGNKGAIVEEEEDDIYIKNPGSSQRTKTVQIELNPHGLKLNKIADILADALSKNARVMVIMNTVSRANALIRILENKARQEHETMRLEWLFKCNEVVCPHHGRFHPDDRAILDSKVSERFGKNSAPGPAVIVGTQTLEQCLDIDSDFMITDLAPMDNILQRIGREHRHERERPPGFETPHCLVLTINNHSLEKAFTDKGDIKKAYSSMGFGSVYEDIGILELTRRVIKKKPTIEIPYDNRLLVEESTHPEAIDKLFKENKIWKNQLQKNQEKHLVGTITATGAILNFNEEFDELSFNKNKSEQIVTRIGLNSYKVGLEKPIISPFGCKIYYMIIKDFMAPNSNSNNNPIDSKNEKISVLESYNNGEHLLNWREKIYKYGRYGLEDASKDVSR